eukprot:24008_1
MAALSAPTTKSSSLSYHSGSSEEKRREEVFKLPLPERKPPGVIGQRVCVIPNARRVKLTVDKIYIYTLEFDPPIPEDELEARSKLVKTQFRNDLNSVYGIWFFDNLRMYTLHRVEGTRTFHTKDTESDFSLQVKHVKDKDMADLKTFEEMGQICSLISRKAIADAGYERNGGGRRYFDKSCNLESPGLRGRDGLPDIVIWDGMEIALERVLSGPIIKIDTTHRVLHRQSVRDLVNQIEQNVLYRNFGGRAPPDNTTDQERARKMVMDEVREELRGAAVITMYNKRVYRIDDYDPFKDAHKDTFFWSENNQDITFADYTKKVYNLDVPCHKKGMLVHRVQKGKRRGEEVLLIPSLCHLTGLTRKMKEHRQFAREFAQRTAEPPRERFGKIDVAVKRISKAISDHNRSCRDRPEGDTSVVELGDPRHALDKFTMPMEIDQEVMKIQARQLDVKVTITDARSGADQDVNTLKDLFRAYKRAAFRQDGKPDVITNWGIMYEEENEREYNILCESMLRVMRQQNLNEYFNGRPQQKAIKLKRGKKEFVCWEEQVDKLLTKFGNMDMLMIILPNDRKPYSGLVYNKVKEICFCKFATPLQCVRPKTIQGKVDQAVQHMIRQMMAKKGGTLWRIQFKKVISRPMYEKLFKNATMFVGMDVNHDWKSDMSTVGVCCSYDKYVSRFFSYIVRQHMTAELIQKLQEILFKALRRFYKENNVLPETIFIYRDGVSESQLEKVSQHEVYQVTQACHAAGSKLGIKYRPSFQFVVVQKAVSARFVSPQYSSAAPGTIVDTQLVSPRFWDFYVIPHEPPRPVGGVHKTATPTRYIIIRNDLNMESDDFQNLSLHLCSMYYNWPGPIRVPACVKYADKIAYMFGTNIQRETPNRKVQHHLFQL